MATWWLYLKSDQVKKFGTEKRANNGAVLNFDPGIMSCILIRYTYDKNLEMIQPLFQEF
jgi:hypothetical protein